MRRKSRRQGSNVVNPGNAGFPAEFGKSLMFTELRIFRRESPEKQAHLMIELIIHLHIVDFPSVFGGNLRPALFE